MREKESERAHKRERERERESGKERERESGKERASSLIKDVVCCEVGAEMSSRRWTGLTEILMTQYQHTAPKNPVC